MSDWDDLFAAAAGDDTQHNQSNHGDDPLSNKCVQAVTPTTPNTTISSSHNNKNDDRKKKKRKSKSQNGRNGGSKKRGIDNGSGNSHSQSSLYHAFLKSRMDPIEKQIESFPSWLSLGPSFCQDTKSPYFSTEDDEQSSDNLSLSPLYHASTSSINNPVLNCFSYIRNLRSCCSCMYEIISSVYYYHNDTTSSKESKMKEQKTSKKRNNHDTRIIAELLELVQYCRSGENISSLEEVLNLIPIGERSILKNKFQSIQEDVNQLYFVMKEIQKKKKGNSNIRIDAVKNLLPVLNGPFFDHLITVIVSLDAAYYRLYYLQVAGHLPISVNENGELIHIPHPATYFGVDNLSWNVERGNEWATKILEIIGEYLSKHGVDCKRLSAKDEILIKKQFDLISIKEETREVVTMDPLSFLHQNRMREGFLLFWSTNWIECNETTFCSKSLSLRKQIERDSTKNSADDNFYLRHETDAPEVLKQWRDSCRDLLCNLYGYATLSPDTLDGIKKVVSLENNINSIIEMGAGTGYLAYLLNEIGIKTDAFDIAPTNLNEVRMRDDVVNEYHGSTAPFLKVDKGGATTLKHVLKMKKESESSALLLCYPPPLTTMASDMLQVYMNAGGSMVIHVGEFKGLTGSANFEKKLKLNYKIIKRFNCLHWGTDNAEVTIWSKKERNQANSLLLPCSNCHEKEASKQDRFLRSLRYCSKGCHDKRFVPISFLRALSLIPHLKSETYGCYNDPSFFRAL